MTIVRAGETMGGTLSELAHASKRFWGYPDEWIEAWRDELTVTARVIQTEEVWVAIDPPATVGFYVLQKVSADAGCLEHLWVHPDSIGKGFGSALLAHALKTAAEIGLSSVSVEADPNAEGFYLRHGARRIGMHTGSVCGQERNLPVLGFSISQA